MGFFSMDLTLNYDFNEPSDREDLGKGQLHGQNFYMLTKCLW